jgi:UPF0176 protein
MSVAVANFYKFVTLTATTIERICEELNEWAQRTSSRGLLVIAEEGVNATFSGARGDVEAGISIIERVGGFVLEPKWSAADKQPFMRWKIDVRPEIVTLGFSCVEKRARPETFLTPAQWHERLSDVSKPAPILIDTRNTYETELGTFHGAVDPRLESFTEIVPFIEKHPELKGQEVLVFCTGGIRCEKAVPFLEERGFSNVKQLHGGILKYLEEFPNGHFKGECFVFDHRVAVDQSLSPTKNFWLCALCGDPGNVEVVCKRCGMAGKVCAKCCEVGACSKDCRYHMRRVTNVRDNTA